ncbi:MAG: hypothetical protein ACQXXJ_01810 [Candidatus Bathyarchaeia archaeon]
MTWLLQEPLSDDPNLVLYKVSLQFKGFECIAEIDGDRVFRKRK